MFAPWQAPEVVRVHTEVLGTWPGRAADYGADVRGRLEAAIGVTPAEHATARDEVARLRAHWDDLLDQCDVVVLPVSSTPCPTIAAPDQVELADGRVEWRAAVVGWTVAANLCGLAAVAFPAGLDASGMPIGLQAVARDEAVLLDLLSGAP
jgi:Asp-tRNA(Asn)/Glu-tRNA(Gln) amidotransferase A subunit family amidase